MRISVKVKTNSKTSGVKKVGDIYEIRVRAKPVEGKANEEVIKLLSDYLNISKSSIHIKSGLKSKNKTVDIGD